MYSDRPISSESDDLLKRSGFSRLLAETIINLDRDDTFTVGVFGKWGSGKTSVVKMMLKELEKQQKDAKKDDQIIVVHFEPWNFSDTNQLLNQFFSRMSSEFKNKGDAGLRAIGNALEDYSEAFSLATLISGLGIWGNIISVIGKNGAKSIGNFLKKRVDSNDIQKQKEEVVELLQKQSNRTLVVIDDIDRLSNEQIRHVFQLVTSVAKFPKTTYLLVFDKEVVVKALEQVQEGSGEDYLEKVIQMPIQIPDIQKASLRQILFGRLDEMLAQYSNVNFNEPYWQKVYMPCADPFIKHIRDINRLCNALEFKLAAISEEVDFTDLLAVTVLEISMPAVYEWIKVNRGILTGDGSQYDFGTRDRKPEEWYKIYHSQLSGLLSNTSKIKSNQNNTDLALSILSLLFPHFGNKIGKAYEVAAWDQLRQNNRIAHPDKFDRYFHLTVEYIGHRKAEITAIIQELNQEEIKAYLIEKDKENTSYELLEEIEASASRIPAERIRIIIGALLAVASRLDGQTTRSLFAARAEDKAERLIYELLGRIPDADRLPYILCTIHSAETNELTTISQIINRLELAYGRLAADGRERTEYDKILPLDGLQSCEWAFSVRVKELLERISIFDFGKWRMTLYLMESFEPEFTREYLEMEFSHDGSVLRFIEGSVTKWIGAGVSYEVQNMYEAYLTKEHVLQAIQNQKDSGQLYVLPERIQHTAVAFYLCEVEGRKHRHEITQSDVQEVLATWRLTNQVEASKDGALIQN